MTIESSLITAHLYTKKKQNTAQYKFTHMESIRLLTADLKNIGSYKSALLNPLGITAETTASGYSSHPTDGGYCFLCR